MAAKRDPLSGVLHRLQMLEMRMTGVENLSAATRDALDVRRSPDEKGLKDLRATVAENKVWLKGNIELCDKGIARLNDDLYKHSQRISNLEKEVGRLQRSRFSFKSYLSRLFNALRNKP